MPCILMTRPAQSVPTEELTPRRASWPGCEGQAAANLGRSDRKAVRVGQRGRRWCLLKPLFYHQILQKWANFSDTRTALEAQLRNISDQGTDLGKA